VELSPLTPPVKLGGFLGRFGQDKAFPILPGEKQRKKKGAAYDLGKPRPWNNLIFAAPGTPGAAVAEN